MKAWRYIIRHNGCIFKQGGSINQAAVAGLFSIGLRVQLGEIKVYRAKSVQVEEFT